MSVSVTFQLLYIDHFFGTGGLVDTFCERANHSVDRMFSLYYYVYLYFYLHVFPVLVLRTGFRF